MHLGQPSGQGCECIATCHSAQYLQPTSTRDPDTLRSRYAGPLTSARPKQQRDADTVLAASLAAEQATAARRAPGGDPFADLGVSFVEARTQDTAGSALHVFRSRDRGIVRATVGLNNVLNISFEQLARCTWY